MISPLYITIHFVYLFIYLLILLPHSRKNSEYLAFYTNNMRKIIEKKLIGRRNQNKEKIRKNEINTECIQVYI